MAKPVDLVAIAIHLPGVDLEPVHDAAKAALEYVQRFNRVVGGSVARTISDNRKMATIAPMLHSISGLRRELKKIGNGNMPENFYFDGSTKDAASALLLLSESAKSIPLYLRHESTRKTVALVSSAELEQAQSFSAAQIKTSP